MKKAIFYAKQMKKVTRIFSKVGEILDLVGGFSNIFGSEGDPPAPPTLENPDIMALNFRYGHIL